MKEDDLHNQISIIKDLFNQLKSTNLIIWYDPKIDIVEIMVKTIKGDLSKVKIRKSEIPGKKYNLEVNPDPTKGDWDLYEIDVNTKEEILNNLKDSFNLNVKFYNNRDDI
jgi:hypothetical protein